MRKFGEVLDAIRKDYDEADSDGRKAWEEIIDSMLDDLAMDDFFGTEGQNDPRGDGRN
jgi:hypothetical protein